MSRAVHSREKPDMSKLKTKPTQASVIDFLASIKDESRRKDCQALVKLMKKVTGKSPRMWGTAMVGFGEYHYKYATGREGDWFLTGFSPRAGALSVHIMPGLHRYGDLLKKLGKFKSGKSCLNIKRLEDVDVNVLELLVARSLKDMARLASGSE